METTITPNVPQSTANEQSAVPSLDSIAAKMTAMRENTLRNQIKPTEQTATGIEESAETSTPVAPNDNIDAEVGDTTEHDIDESNQ